MSNLFTIKVSDLVDFDDGKHIKEEYLLDYKILLKSGKFSTRILKMDDELKLGTLHLNFKDHAFFEISPYKFETYNILKSRSKTVQTLAWVKFLFEKFGTRYIEYGKTALKDYINHERVIANEQLTLIQEEIKNLEDRQTREQALIDYKILEVENMLNIFNKISHN